MRTLALDTSHSFLTIALIEDDVLVQSIQTPAFKTQSESIMGEIDRLFKLAAWIPSDLNALVLTDGPGSYTGLRISMTVAKVLSLIQGIQLYTLSSLQLMSGLLPEVYAVMDARAKRVYLGHYRYGFPVEEDKAILIELAIESIPTDAIVVGDGQLIDRKVIEVCCPQHFIDLKDQWVKVEHFHSLTPRYLKETEDYHS